MMRSNLFRLRLEPTVAHGGTGTIEATRFATRDDLAGPCNYLDYAVLPPGTSIGEHRHGPDEEEYYLVLSGRGSMRLEDRELAVVAGDLVRNPPGGRHGLVNDGDQPLALFIFELSVDG
jgi:mannose-6-phosphate isomerase-like protein (cupin superfamily)